MARSHGWSVLAEKALELAALALSVRFMQSPPQMRHGEPRVLPAAQDEQAGAAGEIVAAGEVVAAGETGAAADPLAFIKETQEPGTRYYRAHDDRGELLAAFYSGGRVRIASAQRRYAGVVNGGHADLLDVENNAWSEVFVRTTPDDRVKLELRGGVDDARILTCEPLNE
jgi:hypothetical protein